jgi:hypothetical protein
MNDDAQRSLAEAYALWASLCGVTIADVMRASGLARHTVENIRDGGRQHRPSQPTLQRVAAGIVKASSRSSRYDAAVMADCYRDLSEAAGYGVPVKGASGSLLDAGMAQELRSPPRAAGWTALVRRFGPTMTPERAWTALEAAEAEDEQSADER